MLLAHLVTLRESDVLLARAWEDQIMQSSNVRSRPNYTALMRPDRFFTGYLGELAFARFLDDHDAVYHHAVRVTGRSAGPEFKVILGGAPTTVEVKTSSDPTHRYLMFPDAQWDRSAIYVACRLESSGPHGALVSEYEAKLRAA